MLTFDSLRSRGTCEEICFSQSMKLDLPQMSQQETTGLNVVGHESMFIN